ncbi:MAG: hypothetical protein QF609_07480, partial [Gammaproteobacteria bacterium]|nr:hypothetical protein [Gammaproteobacteria bacterium]
NTLSRDLSLFKPLALRLPPNLLDFSSNRPTLQEAGGKSSRDSSRFVQMLTPSTGKDARAPDGAPNINESQIRAAISIIDVWTIAVLR